ncbi:kallikrein-4-like [Erethizon dorsatum]
MTEIGDRDWQPAKLAGIDQQGPAVAVTSGAAGTDEQQQQSAVSEFAHSGIFLSEYTPAVGFVSSAVAQYAYPKGPFQVELLSTARPGQPIAGPPGPSTPQFDPQTGTRGRPHTALSALTAPRPSPPGASAPALPSALRSTGLIPAQHCLPGLKGSAGTRWMPSECAARAAGSSYPGGHIINGEDCAPHSQPWQAALLLDNELFCSGVLVHPQWVLSAAHCLLDSYSVGLGLHSLEASQEPGSRVLEPVLSIQHPEYDKPSFANDLMLIKLKEAVPESSTIRSISVASRCPTAGDECLVSGWGRLANGGLPSRLQCVNISVAPQELCSEVYDAMYHYSMFCAGGGPSRRDSCHVSLGGEKEMFHLPWSLKHHCSHSELHYFSH